MTKSLGKHFLLVLMTILAFTSGQKYNRFTLPENQQQIDSQYYLNVLHHERGKYDMAKLIMQEERTLKLRQQEYHRRIQGNYLKHFENEMDEQHKFSQEMMKPGTPTFSDDNLFGQFMNAVNSLIVFDNDPTIPQPKSQTTDSDTISANFDELLTNSELFIVGLVIGCSGQYTQTNDIATSKSICINAMTGTVEGVFDLRENYQLWIPSNIIESQIKMAQINKDTNTAYAYCNFNQFWQGFVKNFALDQDYNEFKSFNSDNYSVDLESMSSLTYEVKQTIAFQKFAQLTSRVAGLLYNQFWDKVNCIRDGADASNTEKTWKDTGACTGYLISNTFDTFLN